MLLNSDPFNRDHRFIEIDPKPLGDLIGCVGMPSFVPTLSELLNRCIVADAVHVERRRVDRQNATGYATEWIGSGATDTRTIIKVMELYYAKWGDRDPLFSALRGMTGTQIVQRDVNAIADLEFRREVFDAARVTQECVLVRGTNTGHFAIGLVRIGNRAPFSLSDMMLLRRLGEFLFPLIELHSGVSAARRSTVSKIDVSNIAPFDQRLADEQIRLSRREYDVCKLLLIGQTVPDIARVLDLKVSTVETYIDRAFAKLDIRTRRQLFEWASRACNAE